MNLGFDFCLLFKFDTKPKDNFIKVVINRYSKDTQYEADSSCATTNSFAGPADSRTSTVVIGLQWWGIR